MTDWVRWTVPAAALISISAPAYAVQYMSIADAQRAAFPGRGRLTEVEAGRVWKTGSGGVFVPRRCHWQTSVYRLCRIDRGRPGASRRYPCVSRIGMAAKFEVQVGSPNSSAKPALARSKSGVTSATFPALRYRQCTSRKVSKGSWPRMDISDSVCRAQPLLCTFVEIRSAGVSRSAAEGGDRCCIWVRRIAGATTTVVIRDARFHKRHGRGYSSGTIRHARRCADQGRYVRGPTRRMHFRALPGQCARLPLLLALTFGLADTVRRTHLYVTRRTCPTDLAPKNNFVVKSVVLTL